MEIIAHIRNDYTSKFGVPRQAGLAEETISTIIFEPKYRVDESLKGLELYDYIWILWEFSQVDNTDWRPTVRPPRLGGNKRMGVFATRSPYRPNNIGISSVKLIGIEKTENYGSVILVSGADLMDGTPVYDIKPYLPYTDSHPEASNGFALTEKELLEVEISDDIAKALPENKIKAVCEILSQDPRPQYIDDPERVFGITYGKFNIRFIVNGNKLTVTDITAL